MISFVFLSRLPCLCVHVQSVFSGMRHSTAARRAGRTRIAPLLGCIFFTARSPWIILSLDIFKYYTISFWDILDCLSLTLMQVFLYLSVCLNILNKLLVQSNLERSVNVFEVAICGVLKLIHEKGLMGISHVCSAVH